MTTWDYIKAFITSVAIATIFFQSARVSDLQIQNKELQEKISYQVTEPYQSPTYEDFLARLKSFGNRDTVFSKTEIVREINHWVPGKTKIDTVTTKYELHISVTEDSK